MSSQFVSFIAFYPSVEGDMLPAELKAAVLNANNQVDTTRLQQFFPGVAGEEWSQDNFCWLDFGTVREDRPDYFEVDMDTNFYPARAWLQAVSEAFPSVRIALNGSDDDNHYTEHHVLEGGLSLRSITENEPSVANMNLSVMIDPTCGLEGTWMEWRLDKNYYDDDDTEERNACNAKVRSVLKAKSASSVLLWRMAQDLTLTPKQSETLMTHPNYEPDFEPDVHWWLGRTLTTPTS